MYLFINTNLYSMCAYIPAHNDHQRAIDCDWRFAQRATPATKVSQYRN